MADLLHCVTGVWSFLSHFVFRFMAKKLSDLQGCNYILVLKQIHLYRDEEAVCFLISKHSLTFFRAPNYRKILNTTIFFARIFCLFQELEYVGLDRGRYRKTH
jgi:hypothetical protein